MGRHLLIAIATSRYDHLGQEDQRPQLEAVVEKVASLFTDTLQVYERALEEVALNPTANQLLTALDTWFADEERDPGDWVVLYYTGHADLVRDQSLYLLTSNFRHPSHAATAFRVDQLADIVGGDRAGGGPRGTANLLVIIDTCFAGEGTATLAAQLQQVLSRTGGRAFYMLGAALPRQEAQAGALADALVDSVVELSRRYVTQQWLFLEQIVPEINRRLGVHDAILSVASSARDAPQFFPNPSFVETNGHPVVAMEAQQAISRQEFRDHWGPRSRGVEFDSQPGFYFSGREAVLRRLRAYLGAGQGDGRLRLVTGGPGSGKSAILSRIVAGSADEDGAAAEPVRIDLAVHLKGRRLEEVSERFGSALGVAPEPDAIIAALAARRGPQRIVVDALDEAAQPAQIADRLLAPLGRLPNVRLVVGTRRTELKWFPEADVVDIDRPEYADRADIAAYVEARLLRRGDAEAETPYRGEAGVAAAAAVASAVADIAYPNFLLARLGVEELLSRPDMACPTPGRSLPFPHSVDEAFNGYLARFGDREAMVRDMMVPLAWAEGEGLPWDNIWAALASSISGRDYSDEDVRWVLENAGAFVLEATVEGRSAYRLYHQALADTLRGVGDSEKIHRSFTEVLVGSAPRRAAGEGVDWLLASRYARTHLATHAGACGRLGHLVTDPLYLLAASPAPLMREMSVLRSPPLAVLRNVYAEAIPHIGRDSLGTAASYLELAARQRNLTEFADRLAGLALPRPWRVPWARWEPRPSNRPIARGDSPISALGLGDADGERPFAIVGREDGSVETWDAMVGELLVRWQPVKGECVGHVAFAATDKGPVVVAAWADGLLATLNLETGEQVLRREPDTEDVQALAAGGGGAGSVCVTTHGDRHIRIRSLPGLESGAERPLATLGKQYGARVIRAGGRPVVVTVGDSLHPDEDVSDTGTIRFWSVDELALLWEGGGDFAEVPHYVTTGEAGGRSVLVIAQSNFGPCTIWDSEERRLLYASGHASQRAWVHRHDDEILLLELYLGKLYVQPLSIREDGTLGVTHPAEREGIQVPGTVFTDILSLPGGPTLLGASADHVRAWDLDALLSEAAGFRVTFGPAEGEELIRSVTAFCTSPGRPSNLYVAAADELRSLDAGTGHTLWYRRLADAALAQAMDFDEIGDRVVLAVYNDPIRAFRAEDGRFSRSLEHPFRILSRLRVAGLNGRTVALAAVQSGRTWSLRAWDLDSGAALTGDQLRLRGGQEDKEILGLAAAEADGGLHVAFASKYGQVMVVDVAKPPREDSWRPYQEWFVPNQEGEYVTWVEAGRDGAEWLLAAATELGNLAIWNFLTGELKASRRVEHLGQILQLRFGTIGGSTVLASGEKEGAVRIWSLDLEERLRFDIAEPVTALAWTGPGRLAIGCARGVVTVEGIDPAFARSPSR